MKIAGWPRGLVGVLICGAAITAPAGASLYSTAVLDDSPVGYWRLGESAGTTVTDSATGGGTQDGTYYGSPTLGEPGALPYDGDTSVRFTPGDGSNDYASVPDVPMTASFSVEMWVKSATSTWNAHGWWSSERGANGYIMHPWQGGTAWRAYVLNNSAGSWDLVGEHDPGSVITDWHHYALTYDDVEEDAVMYFDGSPVVTDNSFSRNRDASSTVQVEIGRDDHTPPTRLGNA